MNRGLYRFLYVGLIGMHPPAFRRQFGGELIGIYDEASPESGGGKLVFDALASLARQWFLRTALWKVVAAVAGGAVELQFAFGAMNIVSHLAAPAAFGAENIELSALMRLIAVVTLGLLSAVICLVFWWRSVERRIGV